MAIITKEYLKPFMDILKSENKFDELLTNIIAAVSKDIVRICNQEIESTVQTLELSGNGTYYLIAPKFPIISIGSLKYRAIPTDAWSAAISSASYAIIDNSIQPKIYYANGFIEGYYNYQLVYTTGYAVIPDDIKQIAAQMCITYFKNSDANGGVKGGRLGLNSLGENIQGIGVNTSFKDLTKEWERRLSKYRRPTV